MSDDEKSGSKKLSYKDKKKLVSKIATPLAGKSLTKKALKLVSKIAKKKQGIRRGVKEVTKAIRKGEKGLVILAGDVSPIDVITHLPVSCEDAKIPYIYVPSREDLGAAGNTKRPTSVVLITAKAGADNGDSYNEVVEEVKSSMPDF